ncbi:SDR family NAD(P)-dependent oxidoreductase [Catellatospora vulcania]|uniref:SDR family NAD(P)-dependent oxidoreductase n=1 Tax=Catellatospora vulcania TaxID=1460450 RepID=UPI0012D3C56A|nr:SDR family NAD(P)-dependent oxidoreductase [Catellatospora vulcania]
MSDSRIECLLVLRDDDFIMRNHHVHGVSVMPGVTFLDILYRALAAQGVDTAAVELRGIVFEEAIVTAEGYDRQIRLVVDEAVGGLRPVLGESRWLRDGEPCSPWRENFRASLAPAVAPVPPPLDVAGLTSGAVRRRAMADMYAHTRSRHIVHGPAMRCQGPLHIGDAYLLAELAQEETSADAAAFHLHPAKLDAATIAAYGQAPVATAEPYIPMFIERFRAVGPLRGRFYVHVSGTETLTASGELYHSDFALYDEHGRYVAEFARLTCKRIRQPELIRELLREVRPAAVPAAPSPQPTGAVLNGTAPAAGYQDWLTQRIAVVLDTTPGAVDTRAGFYDMGLSSVAMLGVSRELEEVVGATLYPTLLFEHPTIEALTRHLFETYGEFRPPATPPGGDDGTGGEQPAEVPPSHTAVCLRPTWAQAPAPDPTSAPAVILLDAPDQLQRELRQRVEAAGGLLHGLTWHGASAGDTGRQQLARLLAGVDLSGDRQWTIVYAGMLDADGDPETAALTAWAVCAAAGDLREVRPQAALFLHRGTSPAHAAVAALARTVTAELPMLRCRSVGLPADTSATQAAAAIIEEIADRANEPEVDYDGATRRVRRHAPAALGAGRLLRDGGVYLITGGAGGLGRLLADHLARTHRARLILTGRAQATPALQEQLRQWADLGADVRYLPADVRRREDVTELVAHARDAFGVINGVIHCAGTVHDGLFTGKQPAEIRTVLGPKVHGVAHLDEATAGDELDFFAAFSSLAGTTGNPGQCDYAYANAYLDHFMAARAARGDRAGRSLSIAWPLWADGGMQVTRDVVDHAIRVRGMSPLPSGAGLDLFARALDSGHQRVVVVHGDPERVAEQFDVRSEPDPDTAAQAASHPAAVPAAAAARVTAGLDPREPADAIAVIGMAGQYPQAPDLVAFWENLKEGRDCITEVPADRWDHDAIFDPGQDQAGKTYSRWGGFLDGVDRFDPTYFGISRRDAERMDPQERLYLRTCWQTLESAGYPSAQLAQTAVGVFVGVMWNHYQLVDSAADGVLPTAMHAAIANRVSYTLNLTGPSMAVDTACSSSLTAVHLAVESLRRGECDMALAGGVNVSVHPQKYLQLAQGRFLSEDGRCRSFGKGGSGYVPGEGVGAVLLKPLSRARADGDHIYGIIRATCVNHTGRTSGFTVPSPVSQAALVRGALDLAGINPSSIGYIEAHGTGTALGDPIEIDGLRKAFELNGQALPGSCAIGSVKSNIGHLESAAGVAGLTKTLLQLHHAQLVPSLHAAELNPNIDLAGTPFAIQHELRAWPEPADGRTRLAGISAFGAGGANAHVVVEEFRNPAPVPQTGPAVVVLSARDDDTLRRYASQLLAAVDGAGPSAEAEVRHQIVSATADVLGVPADAVDPAETLADLGVDLAGLAAIWQTVRANQPTAGVTPPLGVSIAELARQVASADAGPSPVDLAYTLQVGRTQLNTRMALVVTDLPQLCQGLTAFLGGEAPAPGRHWRAAAPATATPQDCLRLWQQGRLDELAAAWAAGADVPWAQCYPAGHGRRRLPLPTPPMREERYWLGAWRAGADIAAPARLVAATPAPADTAAPARLAAATPAPAEPAAPAIARAVEPYHGTEVELSLLQHGIALVTLRDSMFSAGLMHGLEATFAEIETRADIRAVVLTGTETVFSLGATPQALEQLAARETRFTDTPFVYEGLLRCTRPVIAALRGRASGGGLAFGLYADLVVLSADGSYGANFMTYGFTPGMGATHILENRFGRSLATEMFLTGRSYAGDELARRGATVPVVPADQVLATALDLAKSIADKPAAAVAVLKQELAGRLLAQLPDIVRREARMHEQVLGDESMQRVQEHFRKVRDFDSPQPQPQPQPQPHPQPQPQPVVVPAADRAPRPAAVAVTAAPPVPAQRPALADEDLRRTIVASLCAILYAEPGEIDAKLSFNEMGVDSIGAVEIVRDLNRRFGLDIDSVAVYDHPTIPRLAEHAQDIHAQAGLLHASALAHADATAPMPPVDTVAAAPPTAAEPMPPVSAAPPVVAEPMPVGATARPAVAEPAPPVAVALRAVAGPAQPERAALPTPAAAPPGMVALRPLGTPAARPVHAVAPVAVTAPADVRADRAPSAVTDEPIAVIGMAGRFPDADDLDQYWANIAEGRCSVTEVPDARWERSSYFDPDRRAEDRSYSKWAALLSDVDLFDPRFFHMSPVEAEAMDPQQRQFLQQAWAALEDAGYAVTGAAPRTGVYVGASAGDYSYLLREAGLGDTGQAFLGNNVAILAARIAYLLDLRGPTMTVDTACSSSLVAVHLACQAIRSGECDLALAGGVALMNTPQMQVWTSRVGMLSPTGRSAPFSDSADGIVLGEGVGVVVLKSLRRALADGDHVHAVIRASGVNGDGRTNGITAPSAASQARLLHEVHQRAGIAADDLGYLEAHGTGTHLGDPIEVKALNEVLGTASRRAFCGLGSAKANIGHTTTAAGIAGLIKTVLALRHRQLPPLPGFDAANPKLDLADSPLFVVRELQPWAAGPGGARVGAVSSFGFSGTNCHVVLAEAPERAPVEQAGPDLFLLPVSARTEQELPAVAAALAAAVAAGEHRLRDIAYTLSIGRTHLSARAALLAADRDELVTQLRALAAGQAANLVPTATPELAALAQAYLRGDSPDWTPHVAGGRRIPLPPYPFAREHHRVQAPGSAQPRRIGPDHVLAADHVMGGTPLLPGMASVALAIDAAAARGIAGPLRLTGVRWLRPCELTRPRALVLGGKPGPDGVWPFDLTIQGETEPLVRGSLRQAADAPAETVDLGKLTARCPARRDGRQLYDSLTAAGLSYGPALRRIQHVLVGDGEALGVLDAPAPADPWVRDTAQLDAALQVIAALTAQERAETLVPFAVAAVTVQRAPAQARYAHVRRDAEGTYTVTACDADGRVCVRLDGVALRPLPAPRDPASLLYVPQWRQLPTVTADGARGRAVIWHPPGGQALADALAAAHGPDAVAVAYHGSDADLGPDGDVPDIAYFLCETGPVGPPEDDQSAAALLSLVRRLLARDGAHRSVTLKAVIAGAVTVAEGEAAQPHAAGVLGLCASIAAELPRWSVGCVDVGSQPWSASELAAALYAEPADTRLVALRDGHRWTRGLSPLPADGPPTSNGPLPADGPSASNGLASLNGLAPLDGPAPGDGSLWRRGGCYVILGGTGGLGMAVGRHLARTAAARLALIGRRPLDAEVQQRLDELHALGGEAIYLQADAVDLEQLRRAVEAARARFGPVNGAVHAAGVLRDRTLANLGADTFGAVYGPKAAGTAAFAQALRDEPLDFLALFSSAVSFTDAAGQANYAAASTFQDAYAHHLRARGVPAVAVNWGYWGSVGLAAQDHHKQRMGQFGVDSLEPAEAMAAFEQVLARRLGQAVVIKADRSGLARLGVFDRPGDSQPAPAAQPVPVAQPRAAAGGHTGEVGDAAARAYVRRIFAEVLRFSASELDDESTFDVYGVDSLLSQNIVYRLEQDLGELPATLLFEQLTIAQLAGHLARTRSARLAAVLGPVAPQEATPVAAAGPVRVVEKPRETTGGDIAVIGVSGRYPGAADIDEFWANLSGGVASIREVPPDRWDWRPHYDPQKGTPQRSCSKWAGFMDGVDQFDAPFFQILPRDAADIDPQERLFLENCWNLLDRAGYLGDTTHEPMTGVFAGVMYGSYGRMAAAGWARGKLAGAHSAYWSVANRVSYHFDLRGPSFAVDSACSSSLTAIHLACESLRRGECRMAIAGGVNLVLHPSHHVALSGLNMLSADGACKVFDERADGFVPGEGVGAVLLKPLADAERDGDDIIAVIKGSLVNAGGKTGGYTVPNPNAQAELIAEAVRRSGVEPRSVGYIEAHGTGTSLGDPIEVSSLIRAFDDLGDAPERCAVSSVKANIGHLEGAAGIAGFTRALLHLHHATVTPCVNLQTLNPRIDFGDSPFYPPRELAAWPQPTDRTGRPLPRRAGVSSFGAGGANAHVMLEEYMRPDDADTDRAGEEQLFLLSARTPEQLRQSAADVADLLDRPTADVDLRRLAYTSQVGRKDMAERVAVLATDVGELRDRLRAYARGEDVAQVVGGTVGRDEASRSLLSGDDGVDFVGSLLARRQLAKLARIWVAGVKVDWSGWWPQPRPRRVALPAYPFDRRRYWLDDDATTAPAFTSAPAPALASAPQQANAPAEQQVRVALGTGPHLSDHRVGGARWLPGVAALDLVGAAYQGAGGPITLQDVSWPAPMILDGTAVAATVTLTHAGPGTSFEVQADDAQHTVVARGRVASATAAPAERADLAAARRRCAIAADVEAFYTGFARGGLDYGPGMRVVRELWRGDGEALARLAPVAPAAGALFDPALADGALQVIAAVVAGEGTYLPVGCEKITAYEPAAGPCWALVREAAGHAPDGSRFFDVLLVGDDGQILVRSAAVRVAPALRAARRDTGAPTSCRYLRPGWERAPLAKGGALPRTVAVYGDDPALITALTKRLTEHDVRVLPAPASSREDHRRLVEQWQAQGIVPDAIVHLPATAPLDAAGLDRALDTGFYPFLWSATALLSRGPATPLRAVFACAEHGGHAQPQHAAMSGLMKTLALEHSGLRGTVLRVAAPSPDDLAAAVAVELSDTGSAITEIAYRDGDRLLRTLEQFTPRTTGEPGELPMRPGGTYLVTGGTGALGLHVAEFLARNAGPLDLVLVSRSGPGEQARTRMDRLTGDGVQVHWAQADITDPAQVRQLVARTTERHGPIHGIVHAAGVLRDGLAARKDRADIEQVLAPKLTGALLLDEAVGESPLDFFVLFSSIVGETGNIGQADYAYANAFLNQLAVDRQQRVAQGLRHGRTVSIGWPLWQDGGMAVDEGTRRMFAQRWNMVPMRTELALRVFCQAVASAEPVLLAVEGAGEQAAPPPVPAPVPAVTVSGEPQTRAAVEAELRRIAAGFLLVEPAEVDLRAELFEQGFDSISLTQLVNAVNDSYGLALLPTVLFECPNLEAFARYLCEHHAPEVTPAVAAAAPVAAVAEVTPIAVPVAEVTPIAVPVAEVVPAAVTEPAAAPAVRVRDHGTTPIAVIGMAGLLPGSADLDEFWQHLMAGDHLVRPVPADRHDLLSDTRTRDVSGGFVDGVADFDAAFFGISAAEAALMDPQQRLFLEVTWRAVEDAGYRPSALAGSRTGLFAGVSTSDYLDLLHRNGVDVQAHTATGLSHSILANRVSRLLDLRGPSEAMDTACSSALVAIHRAARAILDGDCDLAIAGGVNVTLSPGLFVAFVKSGMLAADGRCKTFDKSADGYVRGEGAGAVLLKRLDHAERDGDAVYAVLRASAVNHGGRSTSLTAPNPEAQSQVLIQAYERAGVDPSTVTYIETHGTGTSLGDPVEVEGLKRAFDHLYTTAGLARPQRPHIGLGSVKTNVGHLESAAGIAGVLKVLLCLKHEQLPPMLHFQELNPYLRLEGTPFFIQNQGGAWTGATEHGVRVRRAGVSSFGFGGSNAHVVLEDYAAPPVDGPATPATPSVASHLFVLSAPRLDTLRGYAANLAGFVKDNPDADLSRIAYTLQTGREAYRERLAVLAPDAQRLVEALSAAARDLPGGDTLFLQATADEAAPPAEPDADAADLAEAWVNGALVEWELLWADQRPRLMSLPGVPFTKVRHWFKVPAAQAAVAQAPAAQASVAQAATAQAAVAPAPVAAATVAKEAAVQPSAAVTGPSAAAALPSPGSAAAGGTQVTDRRRPAGEKIRLAAAPARGRGGLTLAARPGSAASPPREAGGETTPTAPEQPQTTAPATAPASHREPDADARGGAAGAAEVDGLIRDSLAEVLDLPAESITPTSSFTGIGLDSIFRMELVRRINTAYGLELKASELYDFDTVAELTREVLAAIAASPQAAPAVPDPAPAVPEPAPAAEALPTPALTPPPAPAVRPAPAAPAAAPVAGPTTGGDHAAAQAHLARLLSTVAGRALPADAGLADGGLTSFDMLRSVSVLEKRFGALRKTLLFDHPTMPQLAGHLIEQYGSGAVARLAEAADLAEAGSAGSADGVALTPAAPPPAGGCAIVRKRSLPEYPELAELVATLDSRWAKEGGLAGRDIAPLIFLGAEREGYFNFSRRDDVLFAWSYVGSREYLPVLVEQYVAYADRHRLRPNFLSMERIEQVAGVDYTATPFGAIQRLEDLGSFTLSGSRMQRLRYMVGKFQSSGACRVEEYAVGASPQTDAQIVELMGRWGDSKQMVNPYVAVVAAELGQGRLAARHRMFLTHVDDTLCSAIIVTKLPSEPAYLLDLEFYPEEAPLGGLEFAIVRIIEQLLAEGVEMFSFGASFGVQTVESPNAAPEVAQGMSELRSVGVFGEGNFQFKNKFRPTNLPIYLCQPDDDRATPVADIILMIANPDLGTVVPEELGSAPVTAVVAPGAATSSPAATSPVPASAAPTRAVAAPSTLALAAAPSPAASAVSGRTASASGTSAPPVTADVAGRSAVLAAAGHNPVTLAADAVEYDLITDSWAELSTPAVAQRMAQLNGHGPATAPPAPAWLDFAQVVPTPSGRTAEHLLCQSWPAPPATVLHNGLFPTWLMSLAESGFQPVALNQEPPAEDEVFHDLDVAQLRSALAQRPGQVSMVCLELSNNAHGGHPVSLRNLREVAGVLREAGVPLVLDATRVVENAAFIVANERGQQGRGVWKVVGDLLATADAVTMSLSKDFGLDFGGLVAARGQALADRLREHTSTKGHLVNRAGRALIATVLADADAVAAQVGKRMATVKSLYVQLAADGLPVVGSPGGHCVLLDVARMPRFAAMEHPVPSFLAWLYTQTGVRGGPHLAAGRHALVRLAVPVGTAPGDGRRIGKRIVAAWHRADDPVELIPVDPSAPPATAVYHPAHVVPRDIRNALREGARARDDNEAVLAESGARVQRRLLRLSGHDPYPGEVEVFTAGAGPTLLLVHPFNIGAGLFAEQFAGLAQHCQVVVVHAPGVGATNASADLTLNGLAEMHHAALRELGVSWPVHVGGASFGGLTAQAFALRYPQETASLTLICSSYKSGNRSNEVNRLDVVMREDFDRLAAAGSTNLDEDRRRHLEQQLLRCESMDPQTGLRYLDVFAGQPNLLSRLADIAVPTLIIQGRHDTVIPMKTAHLLHGSIPHARFEQIEAGHFPMLTDPDTLNELIAAYLAEHEETEPRA